MNSQCICGHEKSDHAGRKTYCRVSESGHACQCEEFMTEDDS